MRRKLFLRLSLLIVSLTLLWSCHNEDFTKGEAEPQRNNANFFKHVSSATAKSGVDYISILETYNREKDFLSTMPDQKGMPIWEKMHIVDTETATGLIIPLSHDKETMSSLLFATLDDNNEVIGIRNFDNSLLKTIVYNDKLDHSFRERMFYTFIYMDNRTFGNEQFTGIPKDLFVGKKRPENPYRMYIGNFKESAGGTITQTDASGKINIVETNCGMVHQCTHHGGGGPCDYCSSCYYYACDYIYIYTSDESFPVPNTSGSGGGGGGAPPSPEGIPPVDPCTQSGMPFYRITPNCNAGGNIDSPIDDPCDKLVNELSKLNAIISKPKFIGRLNEISDNILTNWQEKAFSFGTSTTNANEEAVTPINEGVNQGAAISISVTYPNVNVQGAIHTHPKKDAEYKSFSFWDLFAFSQANKANSSFKYNLVKSYDGSMYALTMTDQSAFTNFFNNHDASYYVNAENNYDTSTDIGGEIDNVSRFFRKNGKTKDEAYELALAFALKKYNFGMTLNKMDMNGEFKPIFVNESPDQIKPNKKIYDQSSDCNLN